MHMVHALAGSWPLLDINAIWPDFPEIPDGRKFPSAIMWYQPLLHAFPLVFLPSSSYLLIVPGSLTLLITPQVNNFVIIVE